MPDISFPYSKQPIETEFLSVNFTKRIPATVTIDSATSTVSSSYYKKITDDALSPITITNKTVSSNSLIALIGGGSDKNDYKITFTVYLSNGEIKQDDVILQVREK